LSVLVTIGALAGVLLFASAPVLAAECSNEQLRAENRSLSLPDCRGYELVTPFPKGGYPIFGIYQDASHVYWDSLGAPGEPGDSDSSAGGEYLAERSPSGWSSNAINPPASEYGAGGNIVSGFEGFSSDFQTGLFQLLPAGGNAADQHLYLRSHDGAISEVGPVSPPAAVAAWYPNGHEPPEANVIGFSSNLGDIVFEQRGANFVREFPEFLWPGDTTEHNLLEYAGSGNSEPFLVNVRNSGLVHSGPPLNEGAELIGRCGAELGGAVYARSEESSVDSRNALSADGKTIYFTADQCHLAAGEPEVNEVYARIDNGQAGAHTVAISEPSKQDCEACQTATRSEAIFQGASEDGSKAFFLTEQELLPGHRGMNLYSYDFDGPEASAARPDGRISLLSVGAPGHEAAEPKVQGVMATSDSGEYVYFVAQGVLAGANAEGDTPAEGEDNLYVADTVTRDTTFVATLSGDESDWLPLGNHESVGLTPDGRFLLFESEAHLAGFSGKGSQIYRYDAQLGRLTRVSIGASSFANGCEACQSYFILHSGAYSSGGSDDNEEAQAVSISDDGAYVFFQSEAALTPQALNDACTEEEEGECFGYADNVYEWEQDGTGPCTIAGGCVSLLSDGRDTQRIFDQPSATALIGASHSGSDVFFRTADPLVPADNDTEVDIYDARVNGGFPAPIETAACAGEACQGPSSAAPAFGAPAGTATLTGNGNLAPPSPPPSVKPKTAAQLKAERLAKALRACKKKKGKKKRAACDKAARKRYGATQGRKAASKRKASR
jgi:hypothetical protein